MGLEAEPDLRGRLVSAAATAPTQPVLVLFDMCICTSDNTRTGVEGPGGGALGGAVLNLDWAMPM